MWGIRARGGAPGGGRMATSSRGTHDLSGFTLVELLIVITILPMIIGGLAFGLMSIFSLQSGVANRLANTSDLQVTASTFVNDVQSAQQITTAPNNGSSQCGGGTQLVGLEWNLQSSGSYLDVVSYVDVTVGGNFALVRQLCDAGFSTTPTTSMVVANNIQPPCSSTVTSNCQAAPTIVPVGTSDVAITATTSWASTQHVARVDFPLAAPSSTEANGLFTYSLAAVPADSASVVVSGLPLAPAASAGCNGATPGTGTYASQLCLVDFAALTGNNILAAEQGCLEMSVPLPGGSTLYFCIGVTGTGGEPYVTPHQLPTWSGAFLGNSSSSGVPFYTGIGGYPALYQTFNGQTTTVTMRNITVVNAAGAPATGWQVVGVDAESTDGGESITWTSNVPLTLLPDSPSSPLGNACLGNSTSNPLQPNPNTIQCIGSGSGAKTGTAIVSATTPSTFTTTMVGAGLEAMSFGLLLSGAGS